MDTLWDVNGRINLFYIIRMSAENRIRKELEEIEKYHPSNCSAGMEGDDIYNLTPLISNTATVTINVGHINDPPTADSNLFTDPYDVVEDSLIVISII